MKQTERIQAQPMHGRGPFGGGMIGQKSLDFGPSARRLIARLRPEMRKVIAVFTCAIV